jgi:hypothetical protein
MNKHHGHGTAGKFMPIGNFNDLKGNGTYDLLACKIVYKQTALTRKSSWRGA